MNTAILPLAITMMAGPQILSAILFVTGEQPVKASLAFVAAVALAVATGVLVFFGLAQALDAGGDLQSSSGPSTAGQVVQIVLVALLVVAAIRAYLKREDSEPPKWLGTLQEAGPGRAFRFGLLLIFVMPSDVVIMLTTGISLHSDNSSYAEALPFIGATVLIAALPLLFYVLFRGRAVVVMPKVRDWMNANSWAVNIIVYAIFVVLILA